MLVGLGGWFIGMRALVSKWMLAEQLLVFSLVSHGLGAVVNVALNWVMIPWWGGMGAAIATVISYTIAAYGAFFIPPAARGMALIMTRSILLPITLGYRYWPFLRHRQRTISKTSSSDIR